MQHEKVVIFNVLPINSGKCLLHTPREEERRAGDGHGGGGGGKKVKKMKKDRSFSAAASTGGSQQTYEISPSVSRRGIGGKTHSSTRLRGDNNHFSDITTFFIPGLDVKVSEGTSWS